MTGHAALHRQLEERLAAFEGTEAALLFSSGFAANAGTIAALVGPGDVVYCDRKNHASLFDGCRLSRADVRVYPHGDCGRLASLLAKRRKYRRRLIVTDSLFSMDGDLAPLAELADLAEQFDAMLHGGRSPCHRRFRPARPGRGRAVGRRKSRPRARRHAQQGAGLRGRIRRRQPVADRVAGESRPAVRFFHGRPGRRVCRSHRGARHRRSKSRSEERRCWLEPKRCVTELAQRGWNTGASASQIIPIIVGEPERAVSLSLQLRERGLFVPAIRPPTVPNGEACLRISLTAGHTEEMISALVQNLGESKTK